MMQGALKVVGRWHSSTGKLCVFSDLSKWHSHGKNGNDARVINSYILFRKSPFLQIVSFVGSLPFADSHKSLHSRPLIIRHQKVKTLDVVRTK